MSLNYENMKAMWLSQFDLTRIYSDGETQREICDYKLRITQVLDNVKKLGFNTVIVQLRPYADSFYPSAVYPPSSMVVGKYGNEFIYDPFEILLDIAHKMDLSVHAWINPLRCMLVSEIGYIDEYYRIKRWYLDKEYEGRYIVTVDDRLYLNPAYPEVRDLICEGASEILINYNVDGLHMDYYFYPTTEEYFDIAAYSEYRAHGGIETIEEFRRTSLNLLIHSLYTNVKNISEEILFGISPAGVYNTVVNKHFADVDTWCSEEDFIDYICPQIYFGFKHETCAFDNLCVLWQDLIKSNKVRLVIGLSFGKTISKIDRFAGSGINEWTERNDIMKQEIEFSEGLEKCSGVAVFCYQYFYSPADGKANMVIKDEISAFVTELQQAKWKIIRK